jgi:aquaporin Z
MLTFITEFIGTFVFISVILITGEAIPIGIALIAAIYFGGSISGGHFNPAVSTAKLVKGDISLYKWAIYVAAQVIGGLCALFFYQSRAIKNRL